MNYPKLSVDEFDFFLSYARSDNLNGWFDLRTSGVDHCWQQFRAHQQNAWSVG